MPPKTHPTTTHSAHSAKPAVHHAVKPHVAPKKERYFEAVGRRKTAVARVRVSQMHHGAKDIVVVNGKALQVYFTLPKHQQVVMAPFSTLSLKEYVVSAKVEGGGVPSQAEAVRLGIARALILINAIWRSKLKALGYLKRDPRMVESKKFGSRKARRPQQWRKR